MWRGERSYKGNTAQRIRKFLSRRRISHQTPSNQAIISRCTEISCESCLVRWIIQQQSPAIARAADLRHTVPRRKEEQKWWTWWCRAKKYSIVYPLSSWGEGGGDKNKASEVSNNNKNKKILYNYSGKIHNFLTTKKLYFSSTQRTKGAHQPRNI